MLAAELTPSPAMPASALLGGGFGFGFGLPTTEAMPYGLWLMAYGLWPTDYGGNALAYGPWSMAHMAPMAHGLCGPWPLALGP